MNDGGDGGLVFGFMFLFFLVLFGGIGAWLGSTYHGQPFLGFVAGMMCGPLGLILLAVFPRKGYPLATGQKCKFCMSVLNTGAIVCHRCGRDQRQQSP